MNVGKPPTCTAPAMPAKGTFPHLRSSSQQTLHIRHIARLSRCCHLLFADRPHPHVVIAWPGTRAKRSMFSRLVQKNSNQHDGAIAIWIIFLDTRAGHSPLSCAIFGDGLPRTW
ncbi:hypothetical protein NK6_6736 [Bradyrhizobium diazoefficiens]|uniref:Uncharacterized protein n=1 Tax=Bradyrhizobium diazoefficiens TaxID=1355477 RepID=A0A0E4FVU8_9BRAD|nr:hypothetical protein NK6_6736 [Bradyrhizobium diazoefficiens]